MEDRLNALDEAVADRIRISDERRALALAVRKAHENLLEAITPAIDDANFDLMTKSQTEDSKTLNGRSMHFGGFLKFRRMPIFLPAC